MQKSRINNFCGVKEDKMTAGLNIMNKLATLMPTDYKDMGIKLWSFEALLQVQEVPCRARERSSHVFLSVYFPFHP